MLLVCKAGAVIARHDDGQTVRSAAYGAGALVLPWVGRFDFNDPVQVPDVRVFKPLGLAPEHGTDVRLPAVPVLSKAQLHAAAAYRRWEIQDGGISAAGWSIPTDPTTRGVLTAAYVRASADPAYEITNWKSGTTYTTLPAAVIINLALAVEAHVQACFDANQAIDAAIEAGTIATLDQIAAAGWPNNG